jgi:hypothetical protein
MLTIELAKVEAAKVDVMVSSDANPEFDEKWELFP